MATSDSGSIGTIIAKKSCRREMCVIWSQFYVVRPPSHQTRIRRWARGMCVNAYEIGHTGSDGCRSFLAAAAAAVAEKNHNICVTEFTCHFASHAKPSNGSTAIPPLSV